MNKFITGNIEKLLESVKSMEMELVPRGINKNFKENFKSVICSLNKHHYQYSSYDIHPDYKEEVLHIFITKKMYVKLKIRGKKLIILSCHIKKY